MALLVGSLSAGLVAACKKTIVNVIPLAGLEICVEMSPCPASQVTLLEREEQDLEARLTGPDGEPLSGRPVTWTSADPGVASVSSTGTLTGVSAGVTFARAQVESLQASLPVTVLKGPTIALSSQLLQLQGTSGEAPIEIAVLVENSGNGTLSGLFASVESEGSESEEWLVASLQSTGAPTILLVQAFLSNLNAGTYRGTVTITDPSALNSPQTVEVELQVETGVALSPSAVLLVAPSGAFQPATQDVAVEPVGGGVLAGLTASVSYVSGGAEGWLSTSFANAQAPTTLELSGSARFLVPGTYVAMV